MPSLFNNQYNNLASKGRYGDTMLAHVNPQEAAMLQSMGGAGTVNPQTGLREFYGVQPMSIWQQFAPEPEPLPSLGGPSIPQYIIDALPKQLETQTIQVPKGIQGGGFYEQTVVAPPANAIPITKVTHIGQDRPRDTPTGEYYIPLDNIPNYPKTDALGNAVPPLVAKYDASGNLQGITAQTRYAVDENYRIQPEYNTKGQLVATGLVDNREGEGGGFGDFVSSALQDFGPMIALGVGANYLAGSGLLGGATAADIAASKALAQANLTGYAGTAFSAIPTGTGLLSTAVGTGSVPLGPYVSQAAGAYSGSTAAANAAAAGSLTGIQAASLGQNALTAEALARTGITYGGNVTPANIPTTPEAPVAPTPITYPSAPTGIPPVVSAAGGSITPSMLQSIADKTGISVDTLKTFGPSVIQGLIGAGGSYLTADKAKDAAQTQADAQIRAAQIAADAARFRPVGVTTRFGSSKFKTDAQGNVIEAGYTPSAEITGYQDRLRTLAGQGLTDVEAARTAYQPLTSAAQNLFGLGQSYLAKTPEQAAQEYITKQQALLAPSQENQLALLQNKLQQQGRGGLSVAQGGNLGATTPEMQAYYNSIAQSNLALAAQADQEARNRITYGAGLFDTGANLQNRFYSGQTAAYSPFATAMDTSSGLERLAQVPLDIGRQVGGQVTAGAASAGNLLSQGITSAAGTMAPANAYSLGGNLLAGAANSPVLAGAVNKAFGNTPPAQQTFTFDPRTGQYVPVQSAFAT